MLDKPGHSRSTVGTIWLYISTMNRARTPLHPQEKSITWSRKFRARRSLSGSLLPANLDGRRLCARDVPASTVVPTRYRHFESRRPKTSKYLGRKARFHSLGCNYWYGLKGIMWRCRSIATGHLGRVTKHRRATLHPLTGIDHKELYGGEKSCRHP